LLIISDPFTGSLFLSQQFQFQLLILISRPFTILPLLTSFSLSPQIPPSADISLWGHIPKDENAVDLYNAVALKSLDLFLVSSHRRKQLGCGSKFSKSPCSLYTTF
jgi:hypothetical protein